MKQQVPVRDTGVRKTLTLSVMPHHSLLSSIKSHMGMYRISTISQQIPVRLIILSDLHSPPEPVEIGEHPCS